MRALLSLSLAATLGLVSFGDARAQEPLSAAAALVASGRDGEAIALLERLSVEAPARARVDYLRGRLLERGGRLLEAASAYAAIGRGLPEVIGRDAARRRAFLLARVGGCAEALPLLSELGEGEGATAALARGLRAECLLERGELVEAIGAYQRLVREDAGAVDHFAARLGLADALLRAGRGDEARAQLHQALVVRPDHPDAESALSRLRAMGVPEPSFSVEERRVRAQRYARHRRYTDALAELDAAGRPRDRIARARWLHERGMALYKTRRRYAEAAQILEEAYQASGRRAVADAFHAARALSRADEDDSAIRAYRGIVRAHPRSRRAAQAEYLAAWLELHHGRRSGELNMRRFLAGPRAAQSPTRRRAALWHLGFRAFERGQHRRAAELFERYAESGEGALVRGRGVYWLGRAHQLGGRRAQAIAAYRRAIAVEALHWYACLAAERLVELGVEPGDPFGPAASSEASVSPLPPLSLPPIALFYAELGLREDATRALRADERAIRARAPEGRGLEALVRAYRSLGEATRAYRLASQRRASLARRPGPANRWIWEAAYPHPWREAVVANARRQGIESGYVYATMRQESAYDPSALSPAEAVGLLQLLPSNGERWASRLGARFDRSMLFSPVWNIRLGAAEMGALYRRFDRVMPLSVAAYNAGAARVRRWRAEQGPVSIDHFVERIPFDETRNYVRRVMSHYARYRYLADSSVAWPVRPIADSSTER